MTGIAVEDVTVEQRLEHLTNLPIFRELTAPELIPLASACRLVHFRPGEEIVRQGEPGGWRSTPPTR